jgi:tRNA pseudouridine38-40 synthase
MPNYKLLLEYDGSKFYGWQVQPGKRTIQGEVERALEILFREKFASTWPDARTRACMRWDR